MCARSRGKSAQFSGIENGILACFGKMLFDMVFEHVMMMNWGSNIQEKYSLKNLVKIHALFSRRNLYGKWLWISLM